MGTPTGEEGKRSKIERSMIEETEHKLDPVNRPPDLGVPQTKGGEAAKKAKERKLINRLIDRIQDTRRDRPWWMTAPIPFRFNDNVIRDRLLRLIGTETVYLLDREFMMELCKALVNSNWQLIQDRVDARKKWEVEREKRLIFEGKFPLAEGPPGFENHPYFVIMQQVNDEVARRKARVEASKYHRKSFPMFDYSIFSPAGHQTFGGDGGSEDVSVISDTLPNVDVANPQKTYTLKLMSLETEQGYLNKKLFKETVKEFPGIQCLKHTKNLDLMYQQADRIFNKL